MISRSDTCSRFTSVLLALAVCCGGARGATVTGTVQLVDSNTPAVKKGKDLSGVIVWLSNEQTTELRKPAKHAEMLQKDKRFSPHVLVIPTGTIVDFPNLDPIFHNAFSNFEGQIFDVALYPPGTSRSVHFDRPGIVRVFCNIHPSMSAIIAVVDTPYFTTTGKDGSFSISNVPAGTYGIHFFYERAVPETLGRLTKGITIGGEPLRLPAVSISEAGYLPVAHKNKYGRDYPPGAEGTDYGSTPLR